MTNLFLKVNKDLFKLGLNPTEILILAQILEFQTNTNDCFISDKALAENFGVSESTIKREIKKLEELGYITRETKNIKGGKERHMVANLKKIEEKLTSVNLSLDDTNKAQNELCTSVNLNFDKGQIDTIKDNIKDNSLKDNLEDLTARAVKPSINGPEEKKVTQYQRVSKKWLEENNVEYVLVVGNLGEVVATGAKIEVY